mmetsp:Transcript_2578/g.5984  ORF Transcript_2578/g.5984 Transcript_2578/m.5984 type:complete len:267 (-) Transcript_2578:115-915(-)|eukprot:CAMPEP_0170620302 /NCGR_PEP_ID=MMETSP0224-20130122/27986_1 /TAXON_ID=285029 /ORGANISM="Togula jolla, Strain CCCM 725" /LENGTH=266 /DNA_ID=CAMNT_0010946467 /DNA_START=53 /DNA_END=853 /DNA_ORIENTATION=-
MTRSFGLAVAATGTLALIPLRDAFLPGVTPSSPALRAAQGVQGVQQGQSWAPSALAAAAATALAVGVAARRPQGARTAVAGARRELAVAYEDSGVNLVDNGKFAQGLIGSEGVWGPYEFDPLGFSKYTELMPWMREAELKHGRICMLAWLGLVVPDFVRVPGERYSFEAIPLTIDGHDKLNGQVGVNFQILFWIALIEFCCAKKVFEWNSLETAGDYGLTAFFPQDEEGQKRMRLSELKNGRLAMIAFSGAITQAVLTQHSFPWLY